MPVTQASLPSMTMQRERCPICAAADFSLVGSADTKVVLFPYCVESPPKDDIMAPYRIAACNACGVIFLLDYVRPAALYESPHSDAIGAVWEAHFAAFGSLISKHLSASPRAATKDARIAEVGAGSGKLVRVLRALDVRGIEVIDPQYVGDSEGVVVHPAFLDGATAAALEGSFDALASSHTLEHAPDFCEFLGSVRCILRGPGSMVFFSVPNQEVGFVRGDGTALCHEHSVMCTLAHWLALFSAHGFELTELVYFRAHSLMFALKMEAAPRPFTLSAPGLGQRLFSEYFASVTRRVQALAGATPDKENWLCGAFQGTQLLFSYGLTDAAFAGVLDNSPLKHNMRLAGTKLVCRKPADVLGPTSAITSPLKRRVFLNCASYNLEIRAQLVALDSTVETVLM